VWWTIFTAVDLYIGLIIVDSLVGSVPREKLARLAAVRKSILALLILSTLVLAVQIVSRYRHR
jgi:cell division protein FtsL